MQLLIIATTFVASIILIISLYAFCVSYRVNKLGKGDKLLSKKFCQDHLKQFSLLLIISSLLFIGDAVGYALLISEYNATSSHLIFPLIALFISWYSVIFFLLGCIIAIRENKKYKESSLENVKKTENLEYFESTKQSNTHSITDTTKEQKTVISNINEMEVIPLNDSGENEKQSLSDYTSAETFNKEDLYETSEAFPNVRQFVFGNPVSSVADKKPCAPFTEITAETTVVPSLNDELAQYVQQMEEIEEKRQAKLAESMRYEEYKKKQKEEGYLYFKENSPVLIKKYAYTVENLIDKLTQIRSNLFISLFNKSCVPLVSILVYPYRNINSLLFKDEIKKDGLVFDESTNEDLNTSIYNIIQPYIEKLKEELYNNDKWTDESTLPLLIYKIIRNNIIKHYHDTYISQVGHESLEEFCSHITEPIREEEITSYLSGNVMNKILIANKNETVWLIYYYIYEHNIDLPFIETYKNLCKEIQLTIEKQKEQKKYEESEKLKKELFCSHKVKNEPTKNKVKYVSPIEKVDRMTGEQFELYMTKYFAEHGFKATHTPLSGDFGIDLILENDFGKIGVQAKCYSKKVPQDAIREVVAGLKHYGLSSGMVVTNNYFQPAAIQLAKDNNVTLWDRNMLIKKLSE